MGFGERGDGVLYGFGGAAFIHLRVGTELVIFLLVVLLWDREAFYFLGY